MIDPEGAVANALRTLWVWLLISPGIAPLTGLLSEFTYAFGVGLPPSIGLVFGALMAGGIVGTGERRYGRLVVASLLTAGLWIAAASLSGLTNLAVFGSLRLVDRTSAPVDRRGVARARARVLHRLREDRKTPRGATHERPSIPV